MAGDYARSVPTRKRLRNTPVLLVFCVGGYAQAVADLIL
jgi:hypothetical protein